MIRWCSGGSPSLTTARGILLVEALQAPLSGVIILIQIPETKYEMQLRSAIFLLDRRIVQG